jgi:hypothetical protein
MYFETFSAFIIGVKIRKFFEPITYSSLAEDHSHRSVTTIDLLISL